MALATLSIDLDAKLANLEAGMSKATRIAERNAEQMRRAYEQVNGVVAGIATTLGGAFAAAGITQLVLQTSQAIDALNDLKDATGASIESLSGLEQVALRNGGTLGNVSGILIKFNNVLKEADGKNSVSRIIQDIGLDITALKALDPAEALQQVAVAMQRIESDGDRARATQELFGKSVREAAPYLTDLAEAGRLNGKVTTEQAEAAERFNKHLAALQTNAVNAARSIVSDLIPAMNQFLERAQRMSTAGGFFASVGQELKANIASDQLRVVVADIESLQKTIDRQGADAVLTKRMAALRAEAAQLSKEAQAASDSLKGFAQVMDPIEASYSNEGRNYRLPSVKLSAGGKEPPKPPKADDSAEREFLALMERLARRQAAMQQELTLGRQLTEVEKLQLDVEAQLASSKSKLTAEQERAVRAQLAGVGSTADLLQQQERELKLTELLAAAERRRGAADGAAVQGLLDETTTAKRAALVDLEVLLRQSGASGQEFEEALALIKKRLDDLEPAAEKAGEQISTFADQAQRNIQDAFGDTFEQAMEGKFDNIGELWLGLLKRMVAQALATDLANAVFGKTGGGSADMWAGITKLFSGFSGFFAGGGTLGAGQWGIAGEAGPEVVQGPAQIIPFAKLPAAYAAGTGGPTIVQHIVVQGGNRNELVAAMQTAKRSAVAEMMELRRRGRIQ